MKAEAQKIRDAHKMAQAAASDKVQKDIELINSKRQQMMDAEKKRMKTQQNRTEMRDFTIDVELMIELNEKYASGGFDYETAVNDKLKQHGKTDPDAKTAGSSGDAPDAKFSHNGEDHFLEVKKDKNAMFGQIELKHDGEKWAISDKSRKKYPETAKSIEATGFLHKVNKQWGKPTGDYEKDLQLGNVYHTHPDTEPIKAHYGKDRKTNYMQIGGGHGFYHTGEDKAGLGSPELDGKTQLRARMKARGRDSEGKRTYGALVVMNLKEPSKSHHNLDVDMQKEWIEDILMGHKEFKLNEATESAFSIGFRNGQEERIKQNPYAEDTEDYNKYENGFYQGVMQRRVMQTEEIKNPSKKRWHQEPMHPTAPAPYVHRVAVTVSEPDHPMVTKRGETKQKFIRVSDHREDKSVAIERAKKHYSKKGYKVHGAEHVGMVHESVEVTESHVEFRIDHRDKLTGDHKATFAAHDAKVSDTTDKATYVKVPSHKADSFKKAMKGHGSSVELAESDAAWAASMEKKKEDRLTDKDKNTLSRLRAMMAKEKKPVKEELDEAKIGDKVEIIGGSAKGTVGHIGEIRHGLYKGAPKTITVYHGEKDATQVKQHLVKRVTEDTELAEGSFKYHMDKAISAHERGDNKRKAFHLDNAKQARYSLKSTELTKNKDLLDKYKSMTEDTELDEGLKHHVAAAAIAVAGALGGHAHAQSTPTHDTAKPAVTATAQDSDKSPHDGAPKSEHKARIDKAEAEGSMTRGDANVERMKHGLRPSFGRVKFNQESVEYVNEGLGKLIAKGINALHKPNQKKPPLPKPEDRRQFEVPKNEEVAANNVGGGSIAGTQGDAGKKVVMTKEPLKRKPIPKFKNYVSQEHDGY